MEHKRFSLNWIFVKFIENVRQLNTFLYLCRVCGLPLSRFRFFIDTKDSVCQQRDDMLYWIFTLIQQNLSKVFSYSYGLLPISLSFVVVKIRLGILNIGMDSFDIWSCWCCCKLAKRILEINFNDINIKRKIWYNIISSKYYVSNQGITITNYISPPTEKKKWNVEWVEENER